MANPEGMIHALKADSPGSDNDMKVFKVSCFCFLAIYMGSPNSKTRLKTSFRHKPRVQVLHSIWPIIDKKQVSKLLISDFMKLKKNKITLELLLHQI